MNSEESPVANATPIANPSIKLWINEEIKFRYPAAPFPLYWEQQLLSYYTFSFCGFY